MSPRVKLNGKMQSSLNLEDISAIHFDLLAVDQIILRFFREIVKRNFDPFIVSSLCVSAIMRYCRVFSSGIRNPLDPKIINLLSNQNQKTHYFIKSHRDKWIAHSVNDMEETRIVINASKTNKDDILILDVYEEYMAIFTLSEIEMAKLQKLSKALNKLIGLKIQQERQLFVKYLRQLPKDTLNKIPDSCWSELGKKPDRARSRH
jgi:hypothetical protein